MGASHGHQKAGQRAGENENHQMRLKITKFMLNLAKLIRFYILIMKVINREIDLVIYQITPNHKFGD